MQRVVDVSKSTAVCLENGTKVRNIDVRYANEHATHPGGHALAYNGIFSS